MLTRGFEFKNERVFEECKIIERESSPLVVAKKEIILPPKKEIILPAEDKNLFNTITNGSIIL